MEYGSDYISIVDEDGVEYELEVLSTIEYEDSEYMAVTPADADEEAEELEISVLKSVEENGEQILVAVEDTDELERVYELLIDALYEDDEENDDEE